MPLTSFSPSTTAKSAEVNGNFALCVLTDTARTISVTHTWSASQTFSAGIAVTGASTIVGALTGLTGLTVASGGITVTAGGLTVSSGTSALQALTATTGVFSSSVAVDNFFQANRAGVSKALFGAANTASQLINDAGQDDAVIRSNGFAIRFSVNSGTSSAFRVNSDGTGTFAGAVTMAGLTATTGSFSSVISTAHATTASISINTTTGATSDNIQIFFQRGGANKWRVGTNIDGTNTDKFSIFNDAGGINVLAFANTTGVATFGAGAVFAGAVSGITALGVSSTITIGDAIIGNIGANKDVFLQPGGASGRVAFRSNASAETVVVSNSGAVSGVTTLSATTVTANLTGNVTGNCSGTAATVTGAAQAAITSVGTLTSLTLSGAVSGITTLAGTGAISGFTSLALSAGISGVTTISMSSSLTMTAAASKIIPGATSFSHRNSADSADNLLISDAGVVTVRSNIQMTAGTGLLGTSGHQLISATYGAGYTAMTGSSDAGTSYATSTVTLAQLAGRVMAIQASLTSHGLIGA